MGAFFTNLHVRGDDPAPTVPLLRPLLGAGGALISPASGGWVTIYLEATENQDWSKLLSISQRLSRKLEGAVYGTLMHDSDVFCYSLYESGRRLDAYNSRPDYFGPVPEEDRVQLRGDARVVLRFCKSGVSERRVASILRKGPLFLLNPFNMIFAEGSAKALAACLGVPGNRALCGYRYACNGGVGEDLSSWIRV